MTESVELFRCTECGKLSVSHGWLAAHVDSNHRGYTRLGIQPPIGKRAPGNAEATDRKIERLEAEVVDSEVMV